MMTCPHCGGSHPDTARFCPTTGKPIPQPVQPPPSESSLSVPPQGTSGLGSLLFMKPVIQALSRGSVFRRVTAISLYVLAVVIGILGLVEWIRVWRVGIKIEDVPPISFLGLVVSQVLFAVGIYAGVHTILIRARNVLELSEGEFTIIPISSLLTRLTGEIIAVYIVVVAVGGGILIWFLGDRAEDVLPFLAFLEMREAPFIGGLLLMVLGLLLAYGSLEFFYWIAESELVLAAIARNTEVMRRVAERYEQAELPAAHGIHPSPRAGS